MVDIDKVVVTWTHDIPDDEVCAKCHQMTHTPYGLEPTALCNTCAQEAVSDLLAAIEQSQFDRDTYRDEAKGWLGRCDKIEAEYATLKAEYEQSQNKYKAEKRRADRYEEELLALGYEKTPALDGPEAGE